MEVGTTTFLFELLLTTLWDIVKPPSGTLCNHTVPGWNFRDISSLFMEILFFSSCNQLTHITTTYALNWITLHEQIWDMHNNMNYTINFIGEQISPDKQRAAVKSYHIFWVMSLVGQLVDTQLTRLRKINYGHPVNSSWYTNSRIIIRNTHRVYPNVIYM